MGEVVDVERLKEQVSQHDTIISEHEKRIDEMEKLQSNQSYEMKILGLKFESMDSQFMEMKAAVKEDGLKTRESIEKNQEKREKSDEKMNDWIRGQFDNLKASEEAAASRDHETKRTKLQIIRDVALALVAGAVGIQEVIQWVAKNF